MARDEALALQAHTAEESDCESQKTLGGFITAPGLPVHVWGQPQITNPQSRNFASQLTAKLLPVPLPHT